MLCPETQRFIEDNIDLIDKNNWKIFFERLWNEGVYGDINTGMAGELINCLKECNIDLWEESREQVLLERCIHLFKKDRKNRKIYYNTNKLILINYYYNPMVNWIGYSFKELINFLIKYAAHLSITIHMTPDIRETEIEFN